MKNSFYLLLLLVFCLTACTKEEPQNQQRVVDSITQEPIANAKVQLTIDESGGIWSGSSRRLVEEVYTDDKGRYEFTESINTSDGYYELFVFADRYFDITSGQGYSQTKLVELVPEGYLKLRVQKLDTIEFVSGSVSVGTEGSQKFSGYKIDTTFLGVKRAGYSEQLGYWLRRSGDSQSQRYFTEDSLFISRHDTIYYEIVF